MARSGGLVDLFTSRRNMFDSCKYWLREENSSNELVHEAEPSGLFYAKQIQPENIMSQIGSGSFLYSSWDTAIQTNDDISELRENDYVEFRREIWRVVNVTRRLIRVNNQFNRENKYTYIVVLKK